MRISFNILYPLANEHHDNFLTIEVFPDMTLALVRDAIETDTSIPATSQHIYHNGHLLSDNSRTVQQLCIRDGDMLALHIRDDARDRRYPSASTAVPAHPRSRLPPAQPPQDRLSSNTDPELVRLQMLGNPSLRQQMQAQHPELVAAVENPAVFAREQRERMDRQRQMERLNDDPFDVENQRRIEDMIRQERVMENLQSAMEYNPEVFGRVHMLYVNVEVNGHKVKAFVDSGAQATIISPTCGETCGMMRLVDTRFAGVARGVGTAKILGRVHSAQIKIGDVFLACSFTVMEGKHTDLLLGLDMLKRYQAIIDLARDRLVIQGQAIPFLGEAEIPKDEEVAGADEPTIPGPASMAIGSRSGAVFPPGEGSQPQPAPRQAATPSAAPATQPRPSVPVSNITPAHIESLIAMGATREQAVQALQAAEDNIEVAAGLIFF